MPEQSIYLDFAATTPLRPEAVEAMSPFLVPGRTGMPFQANPNSLHSAGRVAFRALEDARRMVAACLKATRPDEIIFTSGATEADNAALVGLARAAWDERRKRGIGDEAPQVIVSAIEHDAVLEPARQLNHEGFEVEFIRPSRDGFIEVRALEAALQSNTVLVSVQAANSEIGSIQPVCQLAAAAHAAGALFHTDATQALGKIPVDMKEWDVDAASFSAHKIGGPKGCGALYLKARTPFHPQNRGGGQEGDKRSGTQDVGSIVGFAAACEAAVAHQSMEQTRLMRLRDHLYGCAASIDGVLPVVEVEVGSLDYLPNICTFLVPGIESDTLVLRFDTLGVEVSGGSACSSASLEPSHVLRAMGINSDDAQCQLRVSMGWCTEDVDIDAFLEALPQVMSWRR